jgi:hypothetical protein
MISQFKKTVLSVAMLSSLCGGYTKASDSPLHDAAFQQAVRDEVKNELDRRKTEEERVEFRRRMEYEKHMLDTELGSFSSFVTTIGILGGVLAFFVFITSRTTPSNNPLNRFN